jgi:hypothetical protein
LLFWDMRKETNVWIAYGDTNLFCTCAPVQEEETDITGVAAPNPT